MICFFKPVSPRALLRLVLKTPSPAGRGPGCRVPGVFWPLGGGSTICYVCAGLGAAVFPDAVSMNRMQQEMAERKTHQHKPSHETNREADQQADETRTYHDRFFTDRQQRAWLRLASAAPLPPGRLTAAGWETMPGEQRSGEWGVENGESEGKRSINPDAPPRRPATYLELMRQQGEG